MKKFWNWKNQTETRERTLYLDGAIADEQWFEDDVTPALFEEELNADTGDISVWINSPGGDCVAAAQIYNMLREYPGKVTIKIDGLAASAASVIAMAGDSVLMSPVSLMMIHNPSVTVEGEVSTLRKAITMLEEVKESIINAYEMKTGLPRQELSRLMDSTKWMHAKEALALGFADGILCGFVNSEVDADSPTTEQITLRVTNSILEKIAAKCRIAKPVETGRKADDLLERLNLLKP